MSQCERCRGAELVFTQTVCLIHVVHKGMARLTKIVILRNGVWRANKENIDVSVTWRI